MAKKNNSHDERVEELLRKALGRYQEILFKAANTKQNEDLYGFKRRFFQTMDEASRGTAKEFADMVVQGIPFYNTKIPDLLRSYGANYSGEEIALTTYSRTFDIVVNSIQQYKDKINRTILERQVGENPLTVAALKDIINKDLKESKVSTVQYANGVNVSVDKYATMLAHTTRSETENLAMIQQALREGIDLVECDIVSPTCDTCAVYQGRVYSISGNDSRYPALYKTAFKSGYSIIHPNCRHSWSPYHAELYNEEENRQILERSNRTWTPDGDGRHFQQTEILREEYARGQQKMRQWNAEIVEYERMKAYYTEQGQEKPYKSLSAFRREVRKPVEKQAPAIKKWRNHKRDENTLGRWKNIRDFRNCPKTLEKLQQIKYNKDKERWEQLKREKKTINDINGKQWSDSFHERAVDTYYQFRESGIELTDHGVARFLQRSISFDVVVEMNRKPFNYSQHDGKKIKFYDQLAIIYTSDAKEIISFVERRNAKGDWNEI